MTEIDQKTKNYGYITAILSIILAVLSFVGPFPFIVCVIMVVIGLICSIYAIMKGDTGGKILGVLGFLMNLAIAALVLLFV